MTLRFLRGRVVIREDKRHSQIIITVDNNPRATTTHRGIVLAVGPPVLTSKGAEIPLFFKVGDIVQFHFEATEKGRTFSYGEWTNVLCMAQREVDCVIE
jgi:co-chaperonin GroES (HSP10)